MVRVLHIFHNMGNGGIEHFVMNYYRFIDREKIQFDFLTSVEEPGFFDEEILSMGGKIFHAYPFRKNPLKNYKDIARIVSENHYTVVHRHTGSAFGYFDLRAARRGGAKALIMHSHASSAGNKIAHDISKELLKIDCIQFACSKEAGEFLFGKNEQNTIIINNAIDAEKFRFSAEKRAQIRKNNVKDDEIVLGHVGAFYAVKNHEFIIDVFHELYRNNKKYVLWLVGDGELRYEIEQKVDKLGLSDRVHFWGNRKDVSDLLQAMDQFILPSFHEGFNIAAVEAQCAGLKCFVSAQCAGLKCFEFIPLEVGKEKWAERINCSGTMSDREEGYSLIKSVQFDIRDAARDLERRYLEYARK